MTIETGAVVNVPLFVNQGERIKVDTRTGEYSSRQVTLTALNESLPPAQMHERLFSRDSLTRMPTLSFKML